MIFKKKIITKNWKLEIFFFSLLIIETKTLFRETIFLKNL